MIRRVGALLAAAGLSVAAVLVSATGAVAATGEASGVSTSDGQIQLIFEATGTDEVIDPNTVELTLDRQVIESDAVPASDAGAADFDRKAILVFDTSSSMNRNERLDDAKQAAATF